MIKSIGFLDAMELEIQLRLELRELKKSPEKNKIKSIEFQIDSCKKIIHNQLVNFGK